MESLIAAYAASDEEEEESSSVAAPKKQGGGLFSSLPAPRKAGGLFGSLPEPKKKGNKVVEFRPPVDLSSLEEDEQEDRASNKRRRSQPAQEPGGGGGGGGGGLLLPAPRNTNALGSGLGLGGRRVAMEAPSMEPQQQQELVYYDGSAEAVYGGPGPSGYEPGEAVYGGPGPSAGYEPGGEAVYGSVPGPSSGYDEQEGMADPVAKADMRRDRREAVKFVQIKQSDLTANRPREDQMRATGIAFGSMFEKSSTPTEKPSKMHRKKHQIGSLLYDLQEKEMELAERRARGFLNKSQTHAKYGW